MEYFCNSYFSGLVNRLLACEGCHCDDRGHSFGFESDEGRLLAHVVEPESLSGHNLGTNFVAVYLRHLDIGQDKAVRAGAACCQQP